MDLYFFSSSPILFPSLFLIVGGSGLASFTPPPSTSSSASGTLRLQFRLRLLLELFLSRLPLELLFFFGEGPMMAQRQVRAVARVQGFGSNLAGASTVGSQTASI